MKGRKACELEKTQTGMDGGSRQTMHREIKKYIDVDNRVPWHANLHVGRVEGGGWVEDNWQIGGDYGSRKYLEMSESGNRLK